MPKKLKTDIQTEKAKSKFSLRKRIKAVKNISEKTEDIKIVSSSTKVKGGSTVSVGKTTLEFQHAYGSLSKDPKYAKNLFTSNYDRIIDSQDFVGIDFIVIQTFIAKNSNLRAETLTNELKEFIKFLWIHLYTTANVELVKGVRFEIIEVAGLIVPVVNSGLIGQTITKQTVSLKKVISAAVKASVIDGKEQTISMIELFFKVLVESVQFGYIVRLDNVLLFRREGGDLFDLSLIPGREFFDGQSVIRQQGAMNKKRSVGKAVSGFKAVEEVEEKK